MHPPVSSSGTKIALTPPDAIEEIEAAINFYGNVKADPSKLKAYCAVKDGIQTMTMGKEQFAQAQQQVAASTKQLGPEFVKAFLAEIDKVRK